MLLCACNFLKSRSYAINMLFLADRLCCAFEQPASGWAPELEGPVISCAAAVERPTIGCAAAVERPTIGCAAAVERPTIDCSAVVEGPAIGCAVAVEGPAIGCAVAVEGPTIGCAVAVEGPMIGCAVVVEGPMIGCAEVDAMTCTKLCIAAISRRIAAICAGMSSLGMPSLSDETASSCGMSAGSSSTGEGTRRGARRAGEAAEVERWGVEVEHRSAAAEFERRGATAEVMRVDAEVERGRIETPAGRQCEDTASEVTTAESTGWGQDWSGCWRRAGWFCHRARRHGRRGSSRYRHKIIGATTASVTDNRWRFVEPGRGLALSSSATAHSEVSWHNVHPVYYYAHFPIHFRRRVGSIGTALAKEKAAELKHNVMLLFSLKMAEVQHTLIIFSHKISEIRHRLKPTNLLFFSGADVRHKINVL